MISTSTKNARIHIPVLAAERTKLWSSVISVAPREDPEPSFSNSKPGFCPGRAITSGGDVVEPASVLRTVRGLSRRARGAGAAHRGPPRERHDLGRQGRDDGQHGQPRG